MYQTIFLQMEYLYCKTHCPNYCFIMNYCTHLYNAIRSEINPFPIFVLFVLMDFCPLNDSNQAYRV